METINSEHQATQIQNLKKDTYFRIRPTNSAPVWVKGEYNRFCGKYSCYKFEDTNHEKLLRGSQTVYINFTF